MGVTQKVRSVLRRIETRISPPPVDTRVVAERARVSRASSLLQEDVTIVDVGCRWGFANAWSALGRNAKVIGFDPDADECAKLQREYSGPCSVTYVPLALGAESGEAVLYLTENPACSSVFPPDAQFTETMPELACARLRGTTQIAMTTLDAWAEEHRTPRVDFLKLDTQGSELMVLKGGQRVLESVRVIECEVEFNPIYSGQPLFGDVDAFLRSRGFVLWRINTLAHYSQEGPTRKSQVVDRNFYDSNPADIAGGDGQLMWAHAYFVRAELARREWSDKAVARRDACVLSVLAFGDLADAALAYAERAPV